MTHNQRSLSRETFAKSIPGFLNIDFLASDMSNRTYYRVFTKSGSFVLMDEPSLDDLNRFRNVQSLLFNQNIRVPEIFETDLQEGFLVLEDFGDITLTKALKDISLQKKEPEYYQKAIHILHDIQERFIEKPESLMDYDLNAHIKEASIFADYYYDFVRHEKMPDNIKNEWLNLWEKALSDVIDMAPNTLVLRDYHVDNLVLLNDDDLGVLDFQDALWGSIMYDYISLIEDARRSIDDDLYKKITKDFLSPYDSVHHQDYLHHAFVIGACRHAKILGVFTRYSILHKKDDKLCHLPRVLSLFINALKKAEQKEILYFLRDQSLMQKER
jgi:aminoglycoside/choline kinase family phosphotransferase